MKSALKVTEMTCVLFEEAAELNIRSEWESEQMMQL